MSVRYDRQAAAVVGLAIAQHERRTQNKALVPYVRVRVDNPGGLYLRDRGGLSPNERAFQRAMYYDKRIHQLTARAKPDARWSLKVEWEAASLIPGRPRFMRVQVFSDTEGARFASRLPAGEKWSENPDLRSAGIQVEG